MVSVHVEWAFMLFSKRKQNTGKLIVIEIAMCVCMCTKHNDAKTGRPCVRTN